MNTLSSAQVSFWQPNIIIQMLIRQRHVDLKTQHIHNGSSLSSWPQPKPGLSPSCVPVSKCPSPSTQLHKQKLESSLMTSFLPLPSNLPEVLFIISLNICEHVECWFLYFLTHIFLVHITVFHPNQSSCLLSGHQSKLLALFWSCPFSS